VTKKDYELISLALKGAYPSHQPGENNNAIRNYWKWLCGYIAEQLAGQDTRFKREQFLKDCGVQVELRKPYRGTQFEADD
jgi:hypothetical protein